MDFKQLRSFVALVDYQNFSRAAEKLHIAQSSVSTHLAQLEKELGVRLVNRTTKTIEVTQAGQRVYRYATQILEMLHHIQQSCSGKSKHILRIGASTIPATYMLSEILGSYGSLYPNDYFQITQCENNAVIDGVLDGRFDVGMTSRYLKRDGLRFVPLCVDRLVIITPVAEHYLQMQRKGITAEALLKEPMIMREEGDRKAADICLEKIGIDERYLNIVARVNDQETVKNMVASGMGISMISEIAAHDFIESRRVLKIDLSRYADGKHIYLVYPEHYTSKHYAWNFIDYLKESREFFWA